MKVQVDHSYLFPPNRLPFAAQAAKNIETSGKINLFHDLAADQHVLKSLSPLSSSRSQWETGSMSSPRPKEAIDHRLLAKNKRSTAPCPETLWPTHEHTGLKSGIGMDPAKANEFIHSFEHLGWKAQTFIKHLDTLYTTETKIFSESINPRPRKLFSKMDHNDWLREQVKVQWEVRLNAENIINKQNDDLGIPVHIHWTHDNSKAKSYDQKLFFVFPNSNDEIIIWNHVFHGAPLDLKKTHARENARPQFSIHSETQSRDSLPQYTSPSVWQGNG